MGAAAVALVALLSAACGSGGSPGPTGGGSSPAPPTTATSSSRASPSAPVSSSPAGPGPTSEPAAPDPRSVAVDTLLRPGTRELKVLYGDLDGDGVEDIVLASVEAHPPSGAVMAQTYLDAYRYDGRGWPRAWEATEPAPPGNPEAPDSVLARPDAGSVSQQLEFLSLIDMAGDGSADLVVGVLNVGAGPGPLDVWAIAFGPEGAVNEFSESTVSGGVLVAAGDQLRLQTPSYRPSDPACCPSRIEHQTIGFDPAAGKVRVLHQSFTPVG
jgi:hypothetical protein